MTRYQRLAMAGAFGLMGALGVAGAGYAVEAQKTSEQAASSTDKGAKPGVTQLNEGSGCAAKVGTATSADKSTQAQAAAATAKTPTQGQANQEQASAQPCPAP